MISLATVRFAALLGCDVRFSYLGRDYIGRIMDVRPDVGQALLAWQVRRSGGQPVGRRDWIPAENIAGGTGGAK